MAVDFFPSSTKRGGKMTMTKTATHIGLFIYNMTYYNLYMKNDDDENSHSYWPIHIQYDLLQSIFKILAYSYTI